MSKDKQISQWISQELTLRKMQADLSTGTVMTMSESLFQPTSGYMKMEVSHLHSLIYTFASL